MEKGRAGRYVKKKEDGDNAGREMTKAEIRFEQVRRQRQTECFRKQASTPYRQSLKISSFLLLLYPKQGLNTAFFLFQRT